MAIFTSAEMVQTVYSRLFRTVNERDPDGMNSLVKSKMVIQFDMTDPQTKMWVDGRAKPVQALFTDPETEITLALAMTADTLHEMLLGTLPLGKAVSNRRLKVKGSIFKALRLEDLFHTCQAQYPQIAKEMLG